VVCGYNNRAELAIPQLTLTNDAWNQDREVCEILLAWTLAKRSHGTATYFIDMPWVVCACCVVTAICYVKA
jgi:hypothetical protein